MPVTSFTVQSIAGLRYTGDVLGCRKRADAVRFSYRLSESENEYTFSQQIMYKEGDKDLGLKQRTFTAK